MAGKKVSRNAQILLNSLSKQFIVTTQEAMNMLNVSETTARRLFHAMENDGVVLRTFGGICHVNEAMGSYSYDSIAQQNGEAKIEIAKKAALLCKDGDVLYLDGGTTIAALAGQLAGRLDEGTLKDITVYANSFSVVDALSGKCTINLIGGRWRENRRDFCGYLAEDGMRKLAFMLCFLGADACEKRGLTTTDFETARLNELVVSLSLKKYALLDATKFDKSSFVPFVKLNELTAIITDESLRASCKADYAQYGATII